MTEGVVFFFDWEMRLMEWLQETIGSSGFGCWLLSNLSAFGEEILLIAIMGFLYWGLNKEFGKYVGLNVLIANVWNPMIKNLVLRLRPYFVKEYNVKLLRLIDSNADAMDVAAQGYSFPSGHSYGSTVLYGMLPVYKKGIRVLQVLAFVLPLLVGISRVFLGVHYPTDVMAGWLLGIVTIFLLSWLQRRVKRTGILYLVIFILMLPGIFYCRSNDYFTSLGMMAGFFLSVPFEEKYVRFEATKKPFRAVLRVAGGIALYFGLNTLLKLPFPKEFLAQPTLSALLVRTLRYTVVVFVMLGVYPMIFNAVKKAGMNKSVKQNRSE